jgi:hypothetical protein
VLCNAFELFMDGTWSYLSEEKKDVNDEQKS